MGLLFESVRGLPDLQFRCQVCGQQTAYLIAFDGQSGVGGDEETRTPDPLLAKEMLFRLSYAPSRPMVAGRYVVGVSGLEPETSALSGQCSNQLS